MIDGYSRISGNFVVLVEDAKKEVMWRFNRRFLSNHVRNSHGFDGTLLIGTILQNMPRSDGRT
jgi:hypothetical protein